jgi:hypothetical protein
MQQQLRLDALDAGRVFQHLQKVPQQRGFDLCLSSAAGAVSEREHIADHRLAVFIYAEGVAHHASVFDGDKAGQYARLEVAQKQGAGGAVIPLQQLGPDTVLRFQHRTDALRREMPQVEDRQRGATVPLAFRR